MGQPEENDPKVACTFTALRADARYLSAEWRGRQKPDTAKVKAAEKFDGKVCVISNDDTLIHHRHAQRQKPLRRGSAPAPSRVPSVHHTSVASGYGLPDDEINRSSGGNPRCGLFSTHAGEQVMARLLSVNVGLPRDITWQGKTVHTGIWKAPVQGRQMVRRLNIDGDGQGDLAGHGGEHRAVLVYQIDSYLYWQEWLGRSDFTHGQFGENFTVDGLSDSEVCIGDRYRVGSAVFEVTQPRVTCYRVGIRMNEPRMPALLVAHGRPGFYFRVLEEGEVEAGDEIVKIAAGPEGMTVAEVDALLYKPGHPKIQLEQVLRITALSAGWRASFEALLDRERRGEGNPGLSPATGQPPAWTGFRSLRVSHKVRESRLVTSLVLDPTDGHSLAVAVPGQHVVLRLKPAPDAPVLLRSYSLSGAPSADSYRLSVKRESHGAVGAYIDTRTSGFL
jgi:MOSC domain-containing protein YiiM